MTIKLIQTNFLKSNPHITNQYSPQYYKTNPNSVDKTPSVDVFEHNNMKTNPDVLHQFISFTGLFSKKNIQTKTPPTLSLDKQTGQISTYKSITDFFEETQQYSPEIINELTKLYKSSPDQQQLISYLIDEKTTNVTDKVTPRFYPSEIYNLVLLAKNSPRQQKLIEKLIDEKRQMPYGEEKPRFNAEEITSIVKSVKTIKQEKFIEKLIDCQKIDKYQNVKARFDAFSIIDLARLYKDVPKERDFMNKLIDAKYTDSYENEVPKYSAFDVHNLVLLKKDYPQEGEFIEKYINDTFFYPENEHWLSYEADKLAEYISTSHFLEKNSEEAFDKLNNQKAKVLKNPNLYVSSEMINNNQLQLEIRDFFINNKSELLKASLIFDKETLNNLLRMRFDGAEEELKILNEFSPDELKLLSDLSSSYNVDGKPIMPTQKLTFIDLIDVYRYNNLSLYKMDEMVKAGKVDIGELQRNLFDKIFRKAGMTEDEINSIPQEKICGWDMNYTHMLSRAMQQSDNRIFKDIVRAANLEPDFNVYLHNTDNIYGSTNAKTKAQFAKMNMNYDKWIKPRKENNIHLIVQDKNTEKLSEIAAQISDNMNKLMETPAKSFLKKQYPTFIEDDEFVIPDKYLNNKTKLLELVNAFIDISEQGQLAQIWRRALSNTTNPARAESAKNTLTIYSNLSKNSNDISKISDAPKFKTMDLTLKMWDRKPEKDIFQGNYSTCCIGMGQKNDFAMPHYIMNTAYNMIEIIDNNTGDIMGNALCYFVKDNNKKPIFVVDNIEISNIKKPSNEVGIKIRDAIKQYAENISKDVTNSDDVPICIGGRYNDVPTDDLPKDISEITLIGDFECNEIYMDLYKGLVKKGNLKSTHSYFKLK